MKKAKTDNPDDEAHSSSFFITKVQISRIETQDLIKYFKTPTLASLKCKNKLWKEFKTRIKVKKSLKRYM